MMSSLRRNQHFGVLFMVLASCFVPSTVCQLALASSPFLHVDRAPPRKAAALSKGINFRDTRSQPQFNKYSPVSRYNTSSMEMEIAAIFKEFAYGSSTSSSSTTALSTTIEYRPVWTKVDTTTPRNYYRTDVTEPKKFIGAQKEVYDTIKPEKEKSSFAPTSISSTTQRINKYDESEISYLINTNDEDLQEHLPDRTEKAPENFHLDHQDHNDDVSITSTFEKRGFGAIQEEIGKAFSFHVYSTGVSFCFVAIACILSISRINTCSQLLPRGYFITLHMMIFLSSFLRSISFFHDPYGAYERLPSVLADLLFNSAGPCMTTAYSIILLVLLRAARIRLVPLNMQSPLVLATVCGIHIGGSVVIDVSSGVLEDERSVSTLNVIRHSVTITWGCILCIGYIISFSGVEKSAHRQQNDLVRLTLPRKGVDDISMNKNSAKSSLTYAARLFLICTLLHGLMIAFIILNIVNTKMSISPNSSESWAWWTQCTLERIVEIVMCVLLLATAFVLTHAQSNNIRKNGDDKIFSILSHCGSSNTIRNLDVYPISNDKSILGNSTLKHSTFGNGSTLGDQNLPKEIMIHSPNSEYTKNVHSGSHYSATPVFLPCGPPPFPSSTLRSSYGKKKTFDYDDFIRRTSTIQKESDNHIYQMNSCNKKPYVQNDSFGNSMIISKTHDKGYYLSDNSQFGKQTKCNMKPDVCSSNPPYYISTHGNTRNADYEISPYYSSGVSSANHVYTKPYLYQSQTDSHPVDLHQSYRKQKSRKFTENGHKSEASIASSPHSDVRVDYLTDISSSNDGLSTTLSNSSTLPIKNYPIINQNITGDNGNHYFLTQNGYCQGFDDCRNFKIENSNNNPLNFLKLSTNSLNEVLKNQSGLIGKFVNPSCEISHYTPLGLDDSISSPSSEYSAIKKSISTGDLSDQKTCANKSGSDSSIYIPTNKQYTVI